MSDENSTHVLAVRYVDYSEYYMVYGVVSLICVMLLLWYFVRSQMYPTTCGPRHHHRSYRLEGMEAANEASLPDSAQLTSKPVNSFTDNTYKFGPLPKGEIGDVTVYLNETRDNMFADQWRAVDGGLYVHNSKTYWKDTNKPNEAPYWIQHAAMVAKAQNQIPGNK